MIKYNLIGKKFHWLTVKRKLQSKNQKCIWLCNCKCGNQTTATTTALRSKDKGSCGCYSSFLAKKNFTKHGKSRYPEYRTWGAIKTRCYNSKAQYYRLYGGRGIRVCKRWKNSFENFFADMGKKPSLAHSIERKNSNGHYEPNNCCWATNKEQNANTSHNIVITYNGKTQILSRWAEELKLDYNQLRQRIGKLKWPIEKAFTTPIKRRIARKIKFHGQSKTIREWANEFNIGINALRLRIIKYHWPIEKAFTLPLQVNKIRRQRHNGHEIHSYRSS